MDSKKGQLSIEKARFGQITAIRIPSKMPICQFRDHSATRRSLDEAFHDEERLVDLLHRPGIGADGRGNGGQSHRATTELVDDGQQNLVVYLVKTILVDVERSKGNLRNLRVNGTGSLHLGEIAHAPQQRIGNSGRSTAAPQQLLSTPTTTEL